MPSHKQGTVSALPGKNYGTGTRSKGSSDTLSLASSFPGSPLNKDNAITDDGSSSPSAMATWYQENVLDAVINDGGHTFGEYNTDYSANIPEGEVSNDGGGAPASAFVPNTASPGEGSVNPADQPAAPDSIAQMGPSDVPFNGVGSQLSTSDSSAAQAGSKVQALSLGNSPYGE